MADSAVVHIGENSPEEVALKLMTIVSHIEHRSISSTSAAKLGTDWSKADRKWVLSTYAECLKTVRNAHYAG